MGNFSISCCRSKSPRLNSDRGNGGNYRAGAEGQYSETNRGQVHGGKRSNNELSKQGESLDPGNQSSNILQHISEREPDDSETDPSSNAFNRPIFAARSSYTKNRTSTYIDSYSSNNSRQRSNTTPLTSSQDHGYNSTTSTNLTQYDGQLIITDSFDNSIQQKKRQAIKESELNSSVFSGETNNTGRSVDDSRLLLISSQSNSDDNDHLSSSVYELKLGQDCRKPNNSLKSSSCSTIFTDGSTISQPNLRQTIQCVSLAVYYHIKNRTSDSCDEIFDESLHPLKIPAQNDVEDSQDEMLRPIGETNDSEKNPDEPDQRTIYSFVKTLFNAAQLTSEYAITTLVYLERLMTYAEMDLTPKTWRRMFLGAIVLSSKVWEDQAVWNVDYAQILEGISVDDINELERQYLELIQFNMNVPSSVYAKYYFHLRTLAMKNGISNEHTLLTVGKARDLEAMSSAQITDWQSSPIHRKSSPVIKMHTSLEKLRINGRARAVLM